MTKEMFKSGWLPSPEDNRDFTIAMACQAIGTAPAKTYPKKIMIPYPGKVENQGNVGACVAYSLIEERMTSEYIQTGTVRRYSPGFHYAGRSASFYTGEGMITRDALSTLRFKGSVPYEDFPFIDHYYNLKDVFAPVADELYAKAEPYRISSYFRLDVPGEDTIANIKEALLNNMLVVTCVNVHESFFDTKADGLVAVPDEVNEKNYGGHCMVTFGTDDDLGENGATITLNHWGDEWGDHGWCHLPYDYPFKEVWAVSDTIDASLIKLQKLYKDANSVSSWARESVVRANELGLMFGNGTNFNPNGLLTRQEMAAALVRLYDLIKTEPK